MRKLTQKDIAACIHPDERSRFILALVFIGPVLLFIAFYLLATLLRPFLMFGGQGGFTGLLVFAVTMLIVVGAFVLMIWLWTMIAEASGRASAAEINHDSLPELEATIRRACEALSYDRSSISAYLVQDDEYGSFWGPLWRDILLINSQLAEAVYDYDAQGELEFVVASHIGVARSRLVRHILVSHALEYSAKAPIISLFVLPWLRATVYSADRVALAVTGDLRSALDAMSATIVGKDLASMVALVGWVDQHQRLKWSFFSFLLRVRKPYPHPVDRIANLLCFARKSLPRRFEEIMNDLPQSHRERALRVLDRSRHAR